MAPFNYSLPIRSCLYSVAVPDVNPQQRLILENLINQDMKNQVLIIHSFESWNIHQQKKCGDEAHNLQPPT